MNRRDAIAALVSLPSVARIAVAAPAPTDVIVVECDGILSLSAQAALRTQIERVWPERKVVICDGRTRIKLIAE